MDTHAENELQVMLQLSSKKLGKRHQAETPLSKPQL